MRRFTLKRATLTASAALFLSAGILSAQAETLRSADIHPDDYPTVLAVRHMGALVKQRTNGRIEIKVYSGSKLGRDVDSIEQVKLGALAMTRVSSAAMHNICEVTRVQTHPFPNRKRKRLNSNYQSSSLITTTDGKKKQQN